MSFFASIIQEVYEAMEEKEWFAADNAEYTYEMLKYSNGVGYKAIHQPSGAVAGILLTTFPGDSEENLGRDIGLPESELCWWLIWIPWQFFRSTVVQASRKG